MILVAASISLALRSAILVWAISASCERLIVPALTLLGIWFLFLVLQQNRPEDVGLAPIEEYHGEKESVLDSKETPSDEPEGSWKVIVEVLRSPMVLLLWTFDTAPVEPAFPLVFEPEYAELVIRGMARMVPALHAYLPRLPR